MKKLIISLWIIFISLTANIIVLERHIFMPVRDITPIKYDTVIDASISREKVVEHINNHFKINYSLEWVNNYKDKGKADVIFHRVKLKNEMSPMYVGMTLAHELCHIKYYCANETWVEFMAFKELYESNDTVLKMCGDAMITLHCEYRAYKGTAYDIGWYILDYLEKENDRN